MKKTFFILFLIGLVSCQSKVSKEDLEKLNGYWEIQQVKLEDGETKEYKINETIDFFEIKNNIGFRQKLMPKFDGRFQTNGIKEDVKIIEKEARFFIEYKTDYGKWQEEIMEIADSTLVLKNKNNLTYEYKRHVPFSLK